MGVFAQVIRLREQWRNDDSAGVRGLMAGGASALLCGCGLFGGNSYRFKMTVEVDTPVGVRHGFSVMDIVSGNKPKLMAE